MDRQALEAALIDVVKLAQSMRERRALQYGSGANLTVTTDDAETLATALGIVLKHILDAAPGPATGGTT